ncbi:fructose-bisphosphate aldolase class I [Candidatus Saccharibacteria bacterium]|nr:fructose-bisphosphate aldolase class I [Candidatus Saccharibacteria bacterium]
MHILVVGNVLKDVYLNLDSRTENFERDGDGKEWLDFSFDSSEHHYFSRTSSFGGAAITLEVLQKMGLSADITDTSFHFDETGPVISGPTGTYRYILTSDNGTSYMVPSSPQKTSFTTPTESVDYLYVDRSAYLTPAIVDKIAAYLDYYKKTKLVLYVKTSSADEVAGLVRHASLIFLEEDAPLYTAKEALEGYPQEKIIRVSEKSLGYMDFKENIAVSRIDRLTHLSAYSIMSATVLGGFIIGKTVEYALKMARINVENATLDATLSLEELENIATSTSESNLEMIAATLMAPGKGILAADESGGSIKKKFEALGIADTAENRHDYREILLSTPGMEEFLSGVILFDETAKDATSDGQGIPDYLISRGLVPGIKVDKGLEKIRDIPETNADETYTKGLEDLPARLREYYQMGLRFSKWRAAFEIRVGRDGEVITPTTAAIVENCRILVEYAAASQSAGLVPIVEPEVVYDGNYDIDTCSRITAKVLDELFKALERHGVNLKACILKCNMVMNGKQFVNGSTPDEVASATMRVLRSNVPLDLAGIVFLSGGQTPEQATANLAAIMKHQPFAWPVSFSFSRALQGPALEAWAGDNANKEAAQNALFDRLTENTKALYNAENAA